MFNQGIKGTLPSKDANWQQNVQIILLAGFIMVALTVVNTFLLRTCGFLRGSHVGSFFTDEGADSCHRRDTEAGVV